MPKRLTQEEFIERAKAVHGDRYDYSTVKYMGANTKVAIICPVHGIFMQAPKSHICEGKGCMKCSHENRKRLVFGVGINDISCEGNTTAKQIWMGMLRRCYSNYDRWFTSYQKCSVCDEWLKYSNFKRWFDDPSNGYKVGYHLDKDIINHGNKVYAPDNCCFVPRIINETLVKNNKRRGNYPIGVFYHIASHKYVAKCRKNGDSVMLGYFNNVQDAFEAYRKYKESYIKEIAAEYYSDGKITKRVYDALMRWEVEITD